MSYKYPLYRWPEPAFKQPGSRVLESQKPSQDKLIFYKYVSEKILLALLSQQEIVMFYFLPQHTLMNSFSIDQLPSPITRIGTIAKIFRAMANMQHHHFHMHHNGCLNILFQFAHHSKCYSFQLEVMPKTSGHRKAELSGTQVIKKEFAERLSEAKEKLAQRKQTIGKIKTDLLSSLSLAKGMGEELRQIKNAMMQTSQRLPHSAQVSGRTAQGISISSGGQVEINQISD